MREYENFQNFCLFWELVVETNQKLMVEAENYCLFWEFVVETNQKLMVGVEMVLVEAV